MEQYLTYYTLDGNGKATSVNIIRMEVPNDTAQIIPFNFKDDIFKAADGAIGIAQVLGVHYQPPRPDGTFAKKRNRAIICNETGLRFESMTAAILQNGGLLPALSKHLRGVPGHLTVNGYTYRHAD